MTTTELVTIRVQKKDGQFFLDMAEWPEHVEFSMFFVLGRPERVRLNNGHIELRLDNARAVYRIDETNAWKDAYVTTLVYSEGPDAH